MRAWPTVVLVGILASCRGGTESNPPPADEKAVKLIGKEPFQTLEIDFSKAVSTEGNTNPCAAGDEGKLYKTNSGYSICTAKNKLFEVPGANKTGLPTHFKLARITGLLPAQNPEAGAVHYVWVSLQLPASGTSLSCYGEEGSMFFGNQSMGAGSDPLNKINCSNGTALLTKLNPHTVELKLGTAAYELELSELPLAAFKDFIPSMANAPSNFTPLKLTSKDVDAPDQCAQNGSMTGDVFRSTGVPKVCLEPGKAPIESKDDSNVSQVKLAAFRVDGDKEPVTIRVAAYVRAGTTDSPYIVEAVQVPSGDFTSTNVWTNPKTPRPSIFTLGRIQFQATGAIDSLSSIELTFPNGEKRTVPLATF